MAFFRERINKRFQERKSVVGAFRTGILKPDIFKEKYFDPHIEMRMCIDAYNYNSLYQASINTMTKFIIGNELRVVSEDEATANFLQKKTDALKLKLNMREVIENTVKTGNGYLELDWEDGIPIACYPIFDSSRMYINCDRYGYPLIANGQENLEEYYLQRVDYNYDGDDAKDFKVSYFVGQNYQVMPIRAIPIHRDDIIHFKLNSGDTGIYGRSHIASTLNDYEMLNEMERSVAINAKFKAVGKKLIQLGSEDIPAQDEEVEAFAQYLENLMREENAIINKPFKMEDLSYTGTDMNLQYPMEHVRHKITSGIAPEFVLGFEKRTNKATAHIELIAYILSIKTDRDIFLEPLNERILKPFIKKYGLKPARFEFGELNLEDESGKSNRILAQYDRGLIKKNEAREALGYNLLSEEEGGEKFKEPSGGMPMGMPFQSQTNNNPELPEPKNTPPDIEIGKKESDKPELPKPVTQPIKKLKPTILTGEGEQKQTNNEVDDILEKRTKPIPKMKSKQIPQMKRESLKSKTKESFCLDEGFHLGKSYSKAVDRHPEKKAIADYANKIAKNFKKARDQLLLNLKKEGFKEKTDDVIDEDTLMVSADLSKKMKPMIKDFVMNAYKQGLKKASQHTYSNTYPETEEMIAGIDKNKDVKKVIDNNVKLVSDYTKEWINAGLKEIMKRGVKEGKSMETIGKEISKLFNTSAWKGIQIAQSELNKVYSQATIDVIKKAQEKGGKKEGYYWWNINPTASKSGTCPICMKIYEKCKKENGFSIASKYSPLPVKSTHPYCVVEPQTQIYTKDGWKRIIDIKKDDYVLSHMGKFRKVLRTNREGKVSSYLRISLKSRRKNDPAILVTKNHRFLVENKWIEAQKLRKGDKIRMLAKECKCGNLYPNFSWADELEYCSRSCSNKYSAMEQHKKMTKKERERLNMNQSKKMRKWYEENPFMKKIVTKNALKIVKEKFRKEGHPFQRPEVRLKANKTMSKNPKYKTFLEKKMEWLLQQKQLNYQYNFPILKGRDKLGKANYFFADFKLQDYDIIIECDGSYWHQNKKEEKKRDRIIQKQGYMILHFSEKQIKNNLKECSETIDRVLKNHKNEFKFMENEITKIEEIKKKHKIYGVAVEHDESLITNGVVSHNCFCYITPHMRK